VDAVVSGSYLLFLIPVKEAESSRIYYGDTTLWLLDAHDCENHVREDPRNTWMACIEKALRPLPGITTLNGEAWGGITIDDIVVR
jgi:hypothetical protein